MRYLICCLAMLLLADGAYADVEKTALRTDSGLRLVWWPKVDAPKGWHFDEQSSDHYAFKAFAPDGSDFTNADRVIYAKADFKPRFPEAKNVESLIKQDISDFSSSHESIVVRREKPLLSGDAKPFELVSFTPEKDGDWERVAYGEEGEYFIIFTLSSRSKDGLTKAVSAFESMIAGYHAAPLAPKKETTTP